MLRLDLKREPHWLDLGHGVRVQVRPCTTALVMSARAARRPEPDPPDAPQALGNRTAGFLQELGRLAIDAWEGVGDAAGQPAAVTPEGIDALLDLWPIAEAFERLYLGPALLLDAEKKRLTALAAWHFGGGAAYCRGCAAQGRPCAKGEPGADGALCPYLSHEPLTDAGWAAWDTLLRCAGQLRITASGIVAGLDLHAAMTVGMALGHCPRALAELLPAGEVGLIRALNEHLGRES